MTCQCSNLRHELAHYVGQDERTLPENLRRQMSVCPECRHYFKQLKTSMTLLQDHLGDDASHLEASLWPTLSKRMPGKRRVARRRFADRASLVISSSAIVLAGLALFMVPMGELPQSNPMISHPVSFPSQPIGFQPRSMDPLSTSPLGFFDTRSQEDVRRLPPKPQPESIFGRAYESR